MSFQAMTWAVEQELPALQKLVLLMLANRTNHDTGRCDPAHDTLAKDCGMSKDSVKRAIAELAEKGLVEIRRQVQNGVHLPNQYTLRVGSSVGAVGADSTLWSVPIAPTVGADSTEGGCTQQGRVGADSTTKQEVNQRSKPTPSCDEKFEEAWKLYPRREGGNSKKAALKAWRARIHEGITAETMIAGVKLYAKQMQDAGSIGTRYVKQASTFFGPDHHFETAQPELLQSDAAAEDAAWWRRAGFNREYEAINAGCTERNSVLWREGHPTQRLAGANVEPWPAGCA